MKGHLGAKSSKIPRNLRPRTCGLLRQIPRRRRRKRRRKLEHQRRRRGNHSFFATYFLTSLRFNFAFAHRKKQRGWYLLFVSCRRLLLLLLLQMFYALSYILIHPPSARGDGDGDGGGDFFSPSSLGVTRITTLPREYFFLRTVEKTATTLLRRRRGEIAFFMAPFPSRGGGGGRGGELFAAVVSRGEDANLDGFELFSRISSSLQRKKF